MVNVVLFCHHIPANFFLTSDGVPAEAFPLLSKKNENDPEVIWILKPILWFTTSDTSAWCWSFPPNNVSVGRKWNWQMFYFGQIQRTKRWERSNPTPESTAMEQRSISKGEQNHRKISFFGKQDFLFNNHRNWRYLCEKPQHPPARRCAVMERRMRRNSPLWTRMYCCTSFTHHSTKKSFEHHQLQIAFLLTHISTSVSGNLCSVFVVCCCIRYTLHVQ